MRLFSLALLAKRCAQRCRSFAGRFGINAGCVARATMQAVGKCRRSQELKQNQVTCLWHSCNGQRWPQLGSNGQHWLPHDHGLAESWLLHIRPPLSCRGGLMLRLLQGLWHCCLGSCVLMPLYRLWRRRADQRPRYCSLDIFQPLAVSSVYILPEY